MGELGINKTIEHVLMKLENETRNTVRDELDEEEFDLLYETRDILFQSAKKQYEDALKYENLIKENEEVQIAIQRRIKNNKIQVVLDLIDLYEFVTGARVEFPKGVLSKNTQSNVVTIKSTEDPSEMQRVAQKAFDAIMDKAKLIELVNRLDEQEKKVKELQARVAKDEERIEILETDLAKRNSITHEGNADVPVQQAQNGAESVASQSAAPPQASQVPLSMPAPAKPTYSQAIMTASTAPIAQPTPLVLQNTAVKQPSSPKGAYYHVPHSNGVDYTTVLYKPDAHTRPPKEATPPPGNNTAPRYRPWADQAEIVQREQSALLQQQRQQNMLQQQQQQKQQQQQPQQQQQQPVQSQLELQQQRRQEQQQPTYSHAPVHANQSQSNAIPANTSQLRGIKQEPGSHLYLESIEVEDENDDEIICMIRNHAKMKGLRLMSYQVIRNKYAWDTVGCKIVVPQSLEHLALSPGFWTSDIKCRRWMKERPRQRSDNGYRSERQRNRYRGNDRSEDGRRY